MEQFVELAQHARFTEDAKRRFVDALRQELRERGIFQQQLAQRVGVDRTHVAHQFACRRRMDTDDAFAMVKALGADDLTERRLFEAAELRVHGPCAEERQIQSDVGRDEQLTQMLYRAAVRHHETYNFRAQTEPEAFEEFAEARDFLEFVTTSAQNPDERVLTVQIHSHVRLWDLYGGAGDRGKATEHADAAYSLASECDDADASAEALRVMGLRHSRTNAAGAMDCFDEAHRFRDASSFSDAWWDVLGADRLRAYVRSTSQPRGIEREAQPVIERLHEARVHWAALIAELTLAEGLMKLGERRRSEQLASEVLSRMSAYPDVRLRMQTRLRSLAAELLGH